jgi:hypothetical protein
VVASDVPELAAVPVADAYRANVPFVAVEPHV